jgi:hypothetical protein
MANPTTARAAETAVISRRDAIVGALALAAGALIAQRPEPAQAVNGQTVTVGGTFYGSESLSVYYSSTGVAGGTIYSSAQLAGHDDLDHSYGVRGRVTAAAESNSAGVLGEAAGVGTSGVSAAGWSGGVALRVNGRTRFTRSGSGTIAKGTTFRTVTGLWDIVPGDLILATLQGSPGTGVYLKYAKRISSTSIRVYLNKKSANAVTFAWFILN